MAATIKVLAQAYPSANAETTLYTCGAANGAVVSTLVVCNNDSSADVITLRICVGGAGDDNKQLIYSGLIIMGNSTLAATLGITLASSDVIKVTAVNGTCAFQIFGQENS